MAEIEKLRAEVQQYRALLKKTRKNLARAEAALARAEARALNPQIGDFVRSPLTNFYGRVTRVVPRPHGKPWVEITPYLTDCLPGKSTLDLYDQWEPIEKPQAKAHAAEPSGADIITSLAASLRLPPDHPRQPDTTVVVERGHRRVEETFGAGRSRNRSRNSGAGGHPAAVPRRRDRA